MNTPTRVGAETSALERFISEMDAIVAEPAPEAATVSAVDAALRNLIACDDWLDESCAQPHPLYYQQFLLHADPKGRYSVVSFVWGPGQRTPIHDHCTWGVIGMLRGAEIGIPYSLESGRAVPSGPEEKLMPGDTATVSPSIGDVHVVRNAFSDRVSISIHVYGSDIGKQSRHVYDSETGAVKTFISGYSNFPDYAKAERPASVRA